MKNTVVSATGIRQNLTMREDTCYTIVKRGVRAKFEQNPELLKVLLSTGYAVLAECSRKDKKWGIGVAVSDPRYMETDRWTGKNYLGRILMEVREELRTAAAFGALGYEYARDIDFELWHEKAGTLHQNPKFHFWEMKQDIYDIWRMSRMQKKG